MADRTEAMDNLIAQDADLIDVASKVTEAAREVLIRISNADDETAQRIRRGLIYTWEVGEIARNRLEERAKIVAWLREQQISTEKLRDEMNRHTAGWHFADEHASSLEQSAAAIEAGDHLK